MTPDRWLTSVSTSPPICFGTSTGVEVRFFMPVLNVPFRLMYVFNLQRGDCPGASCVLNDRFQPQEGRLFKFAIGTTF